MQLKRVMLSVEHPHGPTVGEDVRCCKHAIRKYESNLIGEPPYDRTFGKIMDEAVMVIRQREGLRARHRIDQELFDILWRYMDPYRRLKYRRFTVPEPEPPPTPPLVFPFPLHAGGYVCQGVHYTAGLIGNVAYDFCDAPPGPILAVEGGIIDKLSGHDPDDDTWDAMGIYGWSTYVRTPQGYRYYYTHFGRRATGQVLGQRVRTGEILGYVGNQKFRPDHVHIGVTSPLGTADATRRIKAVANAPRVAPVL